VLLFDSWDFVQHIVPSLSLLEIDGLLLLLNIEYDGVLNEVQLQIRVLPLYVKHCSKRVLQVLGFGFVEKLEEGGKGLLVKHYILLNLC
jgi:hypothetical protein